MGENKREEKEGKDIAMNVQSLCTGELKRSSSGDGYLVGEREMIVKRRRLVVTTATMAPSWPAAANIDDACK